MRVLYIQCMKLRTFARIFKHSLFLVRKRVDDSADPTYLRLVVVQSSINTPYLNNDNESNNRELD
jgi:hypothetical protein